MTITLLRRRGGRLALFAAALCLAFGIGAVYAATTRTVSQKHRAFHPNVLHIVVGDVVHFVNDDEFTHQIYIDDHDFKFESDEKAPGETVDIQFTRAGTFVVECHIHPRMHLEVDVAPQPK
jgi:plastocyanin